MACGACVHFFPKCLPARQQVPGVQTGKFPVLVNCILGLEKQLTSKSINKKISESKRKKRKEKKSKAGWDFPGGPDGKESACNAGDPSSIILPTKVCIVKAMVFPLVMYRYESWTIRKAECQRMDAFRLWCWRRLLRVPWTPKRSNLSILKEVNPEYSLEGLMLKLKLQHFGHT